MRPLFGLYLLLSLCGYAQKAPEIIAITPDTAIATVNGRKLTAREFERMTQNLNPQMKHLAGTQPKAFLEQYALADTLAKEAEKVKIDQTSPYRERLEDARRQVLVNAIIAAKGEELKISDEDVRKYYDANKSSLTQATARVIFVSRASSSTSLADGKTTNTSGQDSKAKMDKAARLAREGKDFLSLAKEYSDDRDSLERGASLPYPVRANSSVPPNIRDGLLKAKAGDLVGPLEHDSGWYLFKVDSVGIGPFESVKEDIRRDLKNAAVQRWIEQQKSKSSVSLDHKPFWDTFLAANNQPASAQPQIHPITPGTAPK